MAGVAVKFPLPRDRLGDAARVAVRVLEVSVNHVDAAYPELEPNTRATLAAAHLQATVGLLNAPDWMTDSILRRLP